MSQQWQGKSYELRKLGPKSPDSVSLGAPCPACHQPFKEGDLTTLVPLGPGEAPEARLRCRTGQTYNAVCVEVHWSCATGEEWA